MSKQNREPGVQNAKSHRGRMKVLLAMDYKGHKVYVRMIGNDMFTWDAVYEGELYSSYIIIDPGKRKKLSAEVIAEARDMCYAGAAATIDNKLGVELSKTDKENVEMFEKSKKGLKA